MLGAALAATLAATLATAAIAAAIATRPPSLAAAALAAAALAAAALAAALPSTTTFAGGCLSPLKLAAYHPSGVVCWVSPQLYVQAFI